MEMQHVPKIQTSPCPDSLAAQKTFTPFIRRGNPVEEEGHLTIEDAHRRSSTSSEANYVSGWTERVPEEFRPATGKDNLPSFASPQTSRRPVHISRTPQVKVDKKSTPWELKAGPKNPSALETILVSADKTATRPRSTLFSEIRKSVFGAGHQTNPQVLEELHRYKEKFQKEKLEKTTNEGPSNDPSEFSVENLYTEQGIFPSKSGADYISQEFSKQEESPETNLSAPSMGVFEFIPVGDKRGEEEMKPEKPITPSQTSMKSFGMPAPCTNVQESQKVGQVSSVVAEATETPKTQVINQKIICTNAKGLSKMSRIDWAKKRFFEDSKISLESLTQSLASVKAEPPSVNSSIEDKKVNAEVATISSERFSENMKSISLSQDEFINKEESVDKMVTQPSQEKLEPPSISARVLRISPTPLKLHKLEKVTLSVSSPKTKLSTPNNFQSKPASEQAPKLTTLDNPNASLRTNNIAADILLPTCDSTDQYQTQKLIASRDEGVQNVCSWCEEATEVIQNVNSEKFSTNDQITSDPVQIGFLPKDQIIKVDSPQSSTSNVRDTKPQDNFKSSFVSNQTDVRNNQPLSGVDKTKFIQTTVKPIDLGLSFADRKGIRPLSLAEEKELILKVQSQARGEDVEPTRESLEPSPWSQSSGSSVPIQTVTKLTSSNMLKITSVTRGQPPQLVSAQKGRPCLDLKGQVDISSRLESAPKFQTTLVTESISAMVGQQSPPETKTIQDAEQKKLNEFGPLQQNVQTRPIQSNQLQLQKAKLFTGGESQHQISSVPKTVACESIGSPPNDDKTQTGAFSYKISKKDPYIHQSRQAFTQEAPKVRSSTYAHGPKISFASLKAAGKVPNKSAFREESYTYPGGYVRGEYYDLGSEFQPQRHVPDFQSFKTTKEKDYKVITSNDSVQSPWTQSSTVATSSVILEPQPQTSKLIYGSPSLDSLGKTQQIFSQTLLSSTVPITSNITTTRNVQTSPTRLQDSKDKHENGQTTTRRSLDTPQISEALSQLSKQGKISSQDSTPSTCQTTDDGLTNRTLYTQDRQESYGRYEIKQQEFQNQQQLEEQQKLQFQQQQQQSSPEQHSRKSEVHKPVHVQKISVSSNQMKITTDLPTSQQKAIHVISTVKKTSPQLETVQISNNSEVETNLEKEPPRAPVGGAQNESSNLLKREIEAEFFMLKIEEDSATSSSTPERKDAPVNEVIETSTTATQKTNECETSFDQSKDKDILKQASAIRESPKTSQQLQLQLEKQETQQPQMEQQPQQHPQQMSQQDEKHEHQSDLHPQQVPKKDEPPQQSPTDSTGLKLLDSERVHKRVTLSKSSLEFVDSSKSSSEAAKLLAEKRLSADDLIRESGKQNIGFKVNHLMAALEKQGSYAEALSNQKKVLNQRGTAVESGQRVKEQLQQLKSPNPTTSDVKKSPKPVRKPQPLLSRSKTVDDPQATQHFSFGADPDFELYLKSRKERFSPSTDEEASRAKESEKLKDKIGDMGDMVVPMSERIKNMESLVGGSFFSALRDKALSSNEASSTKPEDQIPQSLQASFDVISDVTVGDKRRDFGKLKEQAMETRRSIQQQQRQTQRQTEDNTSPSSSQMFQVTAQQQPFMLEREQDIIYQQQQQLKYDEPQQLQYSSAYRGDMYNQLPSNYQQQQQAGDEYYQQQPQQQHGQQQRQRERYRQPYPRQQQQQLSSYESTELFTSSLKDLPPQGMPLGRRGTGKTRSQTNVHGTVTMRTSPATTTPQRRSLCTKFDSDDEFDKLVEINYQQLVEPQEEQQQQQQQYYHHQPQEQVQQYYQHPVQQQYPVQQYQQQQQYERPLQQNQQQHLDPRQHVQKHHERHHSPSSYPREPRHQHQPQRHQQQHQELQQQQQQSPHEQQFLQQQKPPIDPSEEIAVGSVIDLVSQWDAAIEQKLLRQQQLQVAQSHSASLNFNVNASGNVSGRNPTSASQKQTTSGDGRCPAGTTTSGQRGAAAPPSTSAARRVSIEDAATGDELTKLSISEKMKIFSIEAEKQRRKANAGRSRRHDSRYQTQPVTWGEVESAQSHVRESSNQRTGSRVTSNERHDEQDEEFDEPIAERDYVYFGDC